MSDDQLSYMVNRFLSWKLPADFTPDCGISFEPMARGFTSDFRREPIGTNLLTAEQARAMVRHMVEGLAVVPKDKPTDAMARAWTDAAPASEPALMVRYRAMMHAAEHDPPRAGIVCGCGLVLRTPSEYADHCKSNPDHFKKIEPTL